MLLAALALALAACSSGGSAESGTVEMSDGQRFTPGSLTVAVGDTVAFENVSSEAHTVTAYEDVPQYFASGGFESEEEARENLSESLVGQEATYEVTFDEPGTYEYFCIPHEQQGMKATIVVEE